ncbi:MULTISPECIES: hypothetical protein [Arthrobacter]|uniref:Uncharacterized protein n=1 Tax=Arthrobacter caoxuetaonis TaxID=2886935 RepID=A0A9X1MFH0_9MICC|nr:MULTISPECIES: hypothetical protein [Arthrobacter]MCC3283142.1 hypothetical protein [Arthrobacter caoxuetaonis]MCC3298260.1 hypothetical protein [Arthrobacter caoxuetaonis]MCC9195022.1 hypothetical protein [Arthrobacter sp. zg-Y916]USQ57722.1 hypothetical protein NF551_02330 [Arthrobacter caoxuetaonis]
MEPRRFQLEGPSLDALKAKILAEHGPRARIVAAEKVTVGGIGGFLARQHYEVTVELPPRGRRAAPVDADLPSRAGIGALLASAEEAESDFRPQSPPLPGLSTETNAFAELIADLSQNTGAPAQAPQTPRTPEPLPAPVSFPQLFPEAPEPGQPARAGTQDVPAPLEGAGDLIIVVGLGQDAMLVCESMAAAAGFSAQALRAAGTVDGPGVGRAGDRRAVATARAAGVLAGHPIFLAYGAGRGVSEIARHTTLIAALAPDQLWVAVDAGRKPEDTAAWVNAVRTACAVDAVAVEGLEGTATPQSVNVLGLPVGWVDGAPAQASVL